MTDDQLAEVVLALEVYWPDSDLSEAAWMGYKQELGRMDYEMVSSALKLFVTEGRDRVPQVGQIMRRVVELEMDIPSWGEVARILMTALRQSPEVVTWAGVDGPEPRRIKCSTGLHRGADIR